MSGTSERLLSLLSLLQARRDWPGQVLAERLAVSPRTVRRDVDRLRELGYPIAASKGPDGGYRLDAGAHLPPLLFDDEQAVALTLALQLAPVGGAGVGEAAGRALATLRQVMPAQLRHRIDSLQVTAVRSGGGPATEADPAVLVALAGVVRAREVLRFDYSTDTAADSDPAAGPPTVPLPPRKVEPHHVISRNGRWYLLAWDLDRNDWRTYRVDRISPRTPTGPRFTPRPVPGGDVAAFVSGLFKGSRSSDTWPCRGQVLLHAPASAVAPYIGDGALEILGPDRCLLTLGSWSWAGLAASIARYDCDFEVVDPPDLRTAVTALAQRCARAAASSGPDPAV
jgi:predicted DNA-binding transcriptional regulator YafY